MRTLKIGFGYPPGFKPLAWAIQWAEGTPYSHTYLRFTNEMGNDCVFQVLTKTGTQPMLIKDFLIGYKILEEFEFELNDLQFSSFMQFCQKYTNHPYGYRQLIGMGLARLFNLKENPLSRGTSEMVCAELLLLLMQTIPDVFPNEGSITISPDLVGLKRLHDFVAGEPNAIRITVPV